MAEHASSPDPDTVREPARDRRTERAAAAARIEQQATWVDLQIRQAQERGDFDNLPGYGKPIEDLGTEHSPDWWVRRLVERERVTGVLPPALQLRKDDADLDARLEVIPSEAEVRREVEELNDRVHQARYQPLGGPPMITRRRDVETEVDRWRARRAAAHPDPPWPPAPPPPARRWWRRG